MYILPAVFTYICFPLPSVPFHPANQTTHILYILSSSDLFTQKNSLKKLTT